MFIINQYNKILYIGMTNDLKQRIYEHKNGLVPEFSKKYNVHKLVYIEHFNDVNEAIHREKQLKKWSRKKKEVLINNENHQWNEIELES
ncbi:MAG: GIY-YIG nuclease family protein [Eubacteriales bacterium]